MKKILIADDEKDALEILAKKLSQHNYTVRTVATGGEAIQWAKSVKPDLLLLDIVLPDMDGYAVASALKEDKALEKIPIIFITGKELLPQGIEERIAQLGAFDYIMKPCAFEDILVKVKAVLG